MTIFAPIHECAFRNCKALTSVVIPESVTYLATQLFSGCTALKEVSLPDTMTQIRLGVFFGCTSLETITIPKSIELFGMDYIFVLGISRMSIDYPFFGCSALKSIYMTQKVFDGIEERAKSKQGPVLDEDTKKLIVII